MKRLATVVVIALIGVAAALVTFSSPKRKGCPLAGGRDASYSARFIGPVTVDGDRHMLQVTRNGSPMAGTDVCINTEMVGMSGMGYTDKGREIAPGRYQVGFRFGMVGTYRANVVAQQGGDEVSIPLTFKVGSASTKPGGK